MFTNTVYFPQKKPLREKDLEEESQIILTSWTQIRPTYPQLAPLIINKPVKLIYSIPLPPLRSILSYSKKPVGHPYYPDVDHEDICIICDHYQPIINSKLKTPILPCATHRMIYLLRHPEHPTVSYVGQAGATRRSILQRPHLHRIKQHLNKNPHLLWEILELIPGHFRTPTKVITTLETKWTDRLRGKDGLNNTLTIKFEIVFTVQELCSKYLEKVTEIRHCKSLP